MSTTTDSLARLPHSLTETETVYNEIPNEPIAIAEIPNLPLTGQWDKTVRLPNEVVLFIFDALQEGGDNLEELCTFLTHNRIAAASVEKLIYVSFLYPFRSDLLKRVLTACHNLRDVSIQDSGDVFQDITNLGSLEAAPQVQRLALRGFTSATVKPALPRMSGLKVLSFQDTDFRAEGAFKNYPLVASITEVHFIDCKWPGETFNYQSSMLLDMAPDLDIVRIALRGPARRWQGLRYLSFSTLILENIPKDLALSLMFFTRNITKLSVYANCIYPPSSYNYNWHEFFPDLRSLTIKYLHQNDACFIASTHLQNRGWFPKLSQLPRLSVHGEILCKRGELDWDMLNSAKLAGLANWMERTGKPASVVEEAGFLVEEDGEKEYIETHWPWAGPPLKR